MPNAANIPINFLSEKQIALRFQQIFSPNYCKASEAAPGLNNPYKDLTRLNCKEPVNYLYSETREYREMTKAAGYWKPDGRGLDKLAQLDKTKIIRHLQSHAQTQIFVKHNENEAKPDARQLDIWLSAYRRYPTKITPGKKLNRIERKIKGKLITNNLVFKLLAAVPESKLRKSYLNSLQCQSRLIQVGNRIATTYCNARWCANCNRIRTAKLINGYSDELKLFRQPYFVTLTVPNCYPNELRSTFQAMQRAYTAITRQLKSECKHRFKAFKKVECTVNSSRRAMNLPEMHPHYHILIESHEAAYLLRKKWLQWFSDAKESAQDIQPARDNYDKELFKYFAKMAASSGSEIDTIDVAALDEVFTAMRGLRVYQASGFKKISEDLNPYNLENHAINDLPNAENPETLTVWRYSDEKCNYVDTQGNYISTYSPSPRLVASLKKWLINLHLIPDKS